MNFSNLIQRKISGMRYAKFGGEVTELLTIESKTAVCNGIARTKTIPEPRYCTAKTLARIDRTALRRIKYIPTKETVSEEFPFLLNTGRTLYQFNAGTMTARTKNSELRPTDLLSISPTDAEKLSVSDGEIVNVQSAYGEMTLPVTSIKSSTKVNCSQLFIRRKCF